MIEYRARAIADVEEIARGIARDSLVAADRFADMVNSTVRRLHDSPRIGRPRRFRRPDLQAVRSWPVEGFGNHLIFFIALENGTLVVLRVLHGARRIRGALFEPGK